MRPDDGEQPDTNFLAELRRSGSGAAGRGDPRRHAGGLDGRGGQRWLTPRRNAPPVARSRRCRRASSKSDAAGMRSTAAAQTSPAPQWGPLTLRERIGAGAFGEVFRAWDNRLDREVALKLLRPVSGQAAARATAAIEEGRLLARVRHPNVVTVFGADVPSTASPRHMDGVHGTADR